MSTTIDQKVVEMKFDNRQFESNVSTTMSTIDKLKQKLNFTGAANGLKDIDSAAKNVDMSRLGKSVETVSMKFSALQIMGVTALTNITNSAVNAGKRMASALTIDPIKTGLQEYETQINAVQTILANTASKGSTITDVNRALEELNKYADKTIYNFTEMTRNIGTFTAAGIDLQTSVDSIQGIANLAAVSGSTSQQASTAMYQLSQALAAGTVKLMDWNSVVNAGMGGEMFQNALKETSRLLGTGADAAIEASGSFRESLKDGWLTAEVLTETLKKFTTTGANEYVAEYTGLTKEAVEAALKEAEARYGEAEAIEHASQALADKSGKNKEEIKAALQFAKNAEDAATKVKTFTQLWDVLKESAQSGWAQTWKLIIGDFEQAKNLLTPLADFLTGALNKISDSRNALLEGALGQGFTKLAERIGEITKPMTKAVAAVDKVTDSVGDLGEVVDNVIGGKFGNGKDRFDALTAAGQNYYRVQNKVNETLGNSHRYTEEQIAAQDKLLGSQKKTSEAISETSKETVELTDEKKELIKKVAAMTEEQMRANGYTDEQIEAFKELGATADKLGLPLDEFIDNLDQINGRWLLINSFKNVGQGLVQVIKAIAGAWRDVFPPMQSEQLFNIIAGLHKFTTNLRVSDDTADKLRRTLKGIFAALDIAVTIVGGPLKIAFKIISEILGAFDMNVLDLTARIGDAIYGFSQWLDGVLDFGAAFKAILPYITEGISKIKTWFSDLKNSEMGRAIVDGIVNGIKSGATAVKEAAMALGEKIIAAIKKILGIHSPSTVMFEIGQNIIHGLVNGVQSGISWIMDTVKAVFNGLVDFVKNFNLADAKASGTNFIEFIANGIKAGAAFLWSGVSTVLSKCVDIVKGANFGNILATALSGGMLFSLVKIAKLVEAFASPFEALGDIFENTGDLVKNASKVVKSFSGVLKSFSMSIKADALKKIAISLGILVASIVVLTMLDAAKVDAALDVIMNLAFTLAAMYAVIGIFGKGAKKGLSGIGDAIKSFAELTKLSGLLLSIGASLVMLAVALKIMSGISKEDIDKSVEVIASFVALVAGLIVVNKFSGKDLDKAGITIRKLATAMLLLTIVAKIIAGMTWEDMGKAAIGLAGLTIIISALIGVSNTSGPHMDKVGVTIRKIATAMLLLSITAKIIAGMTWGDMGKAAIGIAGLAVIVRGLVGITKVASDRELRDLGSTIIKLSAAILLLSITAKLIADMSWGEMAKGAIGIAALGTIITGLVASTRLVGEKDLKRVGSTLLMMSISIGILAAIAMMLSLMDVGGLAKGIIAVGALSAMMAMLVKSTKDAQDCKGNLIVMTVAIAALALAVAALSFIDMKSMLAATAALSTLIGTFALLVHASKSATGVKMGPLITMTVVVGLLAGIVIALAKVDPGSALSNATALSLLLVSLSASTMLLSKSGPMAANSIKTAALMGLVIAELAIIIGALSYLPNVDELLPIATSLSMLLLAMSAVCLVLTPIGAMGPAAIKGAGVLAAVIAILGTVSIAIGELMTYIPTEKLEEWKSGIRNFMDLLSTLAYGLGEVIGSFVGGLAAGALSGLPDIGTHLSGFMANAQPFLEGMKTVDSSIIKGVGILAGAIVALTAADFINGVVNFSPFGSGFAQLGTDLSAFITNAKPFIDGAAGIDPEIVSGVEAIANAILALTAANLLDGIAKLFGMDSSLSEFGKELEVFGPSIAKYASSVSGIDVEAVKASSEAAKNLAEMASALPNEGGLLGKIFGENSMDTFGAQLVSFGISLKNYGIVVTGIAIEPINASVEATKSLAAMAESIPNMGGVVSWFCGDNDLATFGMQLLSYGTSLKLYSVAVAGLILESINTSVEATKALASMAESIPNMGGLVAFFTGDNDLNTFGLQIVSFGNSLKLYSETVTGLATEPITNSVIAARALAELATVLPSDGGFWSWLKDDTVSLSEFGSQIIPFGTSMKAYSDTVAGINLAAMLSAVTGAKHIAALMNGLVGIDTSGVGPFVSGISTLGQASVEAFIGAFRNANGQLMNVGGNMVESVSTGIASRQTALSVTVIKMVTGMIDKINSRKTLFQVAGIELMSRFISGIISQRVRFSSVFSSAMSSAITTINGYYTSFYNAGSYVVDGFVAGIDENTYKAEAEAAAMASAALQAAKDAIGSNSPAKKFIEVGKFAVQGLANGLEDYSSIAKLASANLGRSIITSMQAVLRINSPSKVAKDEVGRYIVQGVAAGITEDMSAEEAAALKARNIADAFQAEFDKIDLSLKTTTLEHELMTSKNSRTATDVEKLTAEADLIRKKIEAQTKTVELAKAEYETTLREVGSESVDTTSAYHDYLQAQITLSDLTNEYYDTQDQITEKQKELESEQNTANQEWLENQYAAAEEYGKLVARNREALSKLGMSDIEIQEWAANKSGYDREAMAEYMRTGVVNATKQSVDAMYSTYAEATEGTLATLTPKFEEVGVSYATALGDGLNSDTSGIVTSVQTLSTACSNIVEQEKSKWSEAGRTLVMSFVTGFETGIPSAVEAAQALIDAITMKVLGMLLGGVPADQEASATVTPVLNLDDLKRDASEMDQLVADRTGVLASITSELTDESLANRNDIIGEFQKITDEGNAKVVTAIEAAGAVVGGLINKFAGMQVRMDSGALVGQLVDKIDTSLGQIAISKGRSGY